MESQLKSLKYEPELKQSPTLILLKASAAGAFPQASQGQLMTFPLNPIVGINRTCIVCLMSIGAVTRV